MENLKSTLASIAAIVPAVVSRNPKMYPFVGEKTVGSYIDESPELKKLVCVAMFHMQEESEQDSKETKFRNSRGFMGSDAKRGTEISLKLIRGEELTSEEEDWIARDCCKTGGRPQGIRGYRKQIAVLLRAHAVALEPELAVQARQFGV